MADRQIILNNNRKERVTRVLDSALEKLSTAKPNGAVVHDRKGMEQTLTSYRDLVAAECGEHITFEEYLGISPDDVIKLIDSLKEAVEQYSIMF